MFSIYGPTGRVFQGTLEQMRQVRQVHAVDRTRAIDPLLRDGRDGAARAALEFGDSTLPAVLAHNAIAAYAIQQQPEHHGWHALPASDVMHAPVLTVQVDSALDAAWRQLVLQGRGQAPVVNADGVLVGMVTRAEFAQRLALSTLQNGVATWDDWHAQSVETVMLTPVPSVAPNADMRRVASALLESGLPGLAVVTDEGRVCGFISRTDVLRVALKDAGLDVWG